MLRHLAALAMAALVLLAAEEPSDQFWAAARKGDAAAVLALLAKGVDVNTKFRYGATALSYAADRGHLDVVKALLEKGAEVNVKDTFYGATPLTWAVSKGHTEVARLLIGRGADGGAVLQGVASSGNIELARAILDRGGLKPETLTSALVAAQKAGRTELAAILEKAGAKPPPKADFPVDLATLEAYAGSYKGPADKQLRLAVKDGKLIGGMAGERLFTLGAFDLTHFRVIEVEGIAVTFQLLDGKVVGVTVKEGPTTETYQRTP